MTILVPTDFAENSKTIVQWAHALAAANGETLALMHVVDFTADDNAWRVLWSAPDEIELQAREAAAAKLAELYDEVIGDDASFETVVEFGEPAEAILATSQREDVSLIVVGTVGESRLQEIFFGHTPGRLVRESSVPVVAIPPSFDFRPIERILAPVDFSEPSRRSLALAAEMASNSGASLEVLNAFDAPQPPPFLGLPGAEFGAKMDEFKEARMAQLTEFVKAVGVEGEVAEQWIVASRPAEAIERIGEERSIDMVVMGTAGRSGVRRFFLGSTAERVLRNTDRPVLVLGPERD